MNSIWRNWSIVWRKVKMRLETLRGVWLQLWRNTRGSLRIANISVWKVPITTLMPLMVLNWVSAFAIWRKQWRNWVDTSICDLWLCWPKLKLNTTILFARNVSLKTTKPKLKTQSSNWTRRKRWHSRKPGNRWQLHSVPSFQLFYPELKPNFSHQKV